MNNLPTSGRLPQLDTIRGLALWGIFIVNIVWFSIPPARFGELYSGGPHWYNDFINFLRTELFGGRTATLFALLFGLGLSMQWQKWKSVSFLLKRNLVLALFGIVHIVTLLGGDILLDYALFGFIGVLLLQLNKRITLILALVILLYPSILMALQEIGWIGPLGPGSGGLKLNPDEMVALFQTGHFSDQVAYRIHQYAAIWQKPWVLNFYFPPVFGCFLVGLFLGRTSFTSSFENKKRYTRIFLITLIYKTILTATNHIHTDFFTAIKDSFMFKVLFQYDQYVTSALMISLVIATINSPVMKYVWKPFQMVGRMSLTTYILESVFAAFLFYSIGFGQYNLLSPLEVQLFGLLFFTVIVLFAYFWQRKFRQGPLEWIWRKLSYNKSMTPQQS